MVISTRERVVDHQERVPLHPPGMFSVPWLTAGSYRCSGKPPSPGRRRPRTMGEAAHAHGIKAAAAGGAEDGHITAVQARGCASQITTDSATNASKISREDAADRTDGGACAAEGTPVAEMAAIRAAAIAATSGTFIVALGRGIHAKTPTMPKMEPAVSDVPDTRIHLGRSATVGTPPSAPAEALSLGEGLTWQHSCGSVHSTGQRM